jgi:hypothetical protein
MKALFGNMWYRRRRRNSKTMWVMSKPVIRLVPEVGHGGVCF